jgi:hypothetical protein
MQSNISCILNIWQVDKLPVANPSSVNTKNKSKKVKKPLKKTGKKQSKANKKHSAGKKKSANKASKRVSKANRKHSAGKKKSGKEASKRVSKAQRKHSASKRKSEKAVGKKSKKNSKKSGNKKNGQKKRKNKSKKDRKKNSTASNRTKTGKVGKSAKPSGKVRQSSTTCGVADMVAAMKKFTAYTANLNQNKRITRFVSQSQSKASKALTAFESAHSLLGDATANGTLCNNKTANSTVSTAYRTLQNCSKSAASLCSVELSPAENATVNSCLVSLDAFIVSFQVHTKKSQESLFKETVSQDF